MGVVFVNKKWVFHEWICLLNDFSDTLSFYMSLRYIFEDKNTQGERGRLRVHKAYC